jgi:hypothetical protein
MRSSASQNVLDPSQNLPDASQNLPDAAQTGLFVKCDLNDAHATQVNFQTSLVADSSARNGSGADRAGSPGWNDAIDVSGRAVGGCGVNLSSR